MTSAWLSPSTADAEMKNVYTDGYKITSTMVIGAPGVDSTDGGMCFGVEPETNGGYCHVHTTTTGYTLA